MKKRHIERIPYEGLKNASHIEIKIYYALGGMNYFNGCSSPRGFYISVCPVTVNAGSVSYELFTGIRQFLLEANRYSEKQYERAIEMSGAVRDDLIRQVLDKHQITSGEEDTDAA